MVIQVVQLLKKIHSYCLQKVICLLNVGVQISKNLCTTYKSVFPSNFKFSDNKY